jgi:hypothetical protein
MAANVKKYGNFLINTIKWTNISIFPPKKVDLYFG